MTVLVVTVDKVNKTVKFEYKSYRTCVAPGTCPSPNWGTNQADWDQVLAGFGLRVVGNYVNLDPSTILWKVKSTNCAIGRLTGASATATVWRESPPGTVAEQTAHDLPLNIISDRGSAWDLGTTGGTGWDQFVSAAATIVQHGSSVDDVYYQTVLTLQFDSIPSDMTNDQIQSDLRIGGLAF
jgi:hypothetical protein